MLSTFGPSRRLPAAVALLAVVSLAPVQLGAPAGGAAPAAAPQHAPQHAPDACGSPVLKENGQPWTCTFVDDFAGTGLDPTKWIARDTATSGYRLGQTCLRTGPENLRVGDGSLRLIARREPRRFDCLKGLGILLTRYTGAMIGTRGRFSQTYGRFEIRAKYPETRTSGVHGGFWMYPQEQTYGIWPNSGEIDVAEWWSYDPTLVLPSLHFNGRDPEVDSGWDCRVSDPSEFHTYAVVWTRSGFEFSIDGQVCFERSPEPRGRLVAPQPFDHPFSMILNMTVGSGGLGSRVTPLTELPATYVVDYVKAWS